ncbi:MAG: hypothetical protein WC627_00550 [Legionella sp.]|jgi:hypothetical protein
MWLKIKSWIIHHKFFLIALLSVFLIAGLSIPLFCLCYPAVLTTIINFTFFGWPPLAFLGSISLPAALSALAFIAGSIASTALTGVLFLAVQIKTIVQHSILLFAKEEPLVTASPYINKHLNTEIAYVYDNEFMDEFVAEEKSEENKNTSEPEIDRDEKENLEDSDIDSKSFSPNI